VVRAQGKGKSMSEIQELGCSTPDSKSELCKKCKRYAPHEEYEEFRLEHKLMRPNECIGYIHKLQGSLL